MTSSQPIVLAMGTRPEIIKMLPVYFELKKRGLPTCLLHTGQHSDMADALYDLFDVKPDRSIELDRSEISAADCDLSLLSSLLLKHISRALKEIDPRMVLVHGDTSSAVMAALAAFYQQRPVAHVEAGLRSHNEYNPFPEEKNRTLIAKLAHWHFAPTRKAQENLHNDGVVEKDIYVVGNTIVEAAKMGAAKLEEHRARKGAKPIALIDALEAQSQGKKIILVTVHRRENQEQNIARIAQAVLEIAKRFEDVLVVWPVHPNPVVKQAVHAELALATADVAKRLHVTEPLDYPVLLWVLKHAWLTLTDSGGIQEEAVALSTPVLVLRESTERPEIIDVGAGLLIGAEKANIVKQVEHLYQNPARHQEMCQAVNPFGDGTSAHQICNILVRDQSERSYAHAV